MIYNLERQLPVNVDDDFTVQIKIAGEETLHFISGFKKLHDLIDKNHLLSLLTNGYQ